MTPPLPSASRQTYRQLQISPFANLENSVAPTNGIQSVPLAFSPAFPGSTAEPPVGYALELTSLYHPFLLEIVLSGQTEAQNLATQIEVLAQMSLSRRGVLLWEGSPNLFTIRPKFKRSAGFFSDFALFAGGWGVQFQSPLIVQSPGELELAARLVMVVANATLEPEHMEYTYRVYGANEPEAGPFFKSLQSFLGQGAIGYGLVAS
jgi:hypothetical protein